MTRRSVWQKFSLSWLPVMATMVPPSSRNFSNTAWRCSIDSRRLSGRLSSLNRSPATSRTSTFSCSQYAATRSTARRRSSVRSIRPMRSPRCQSAVCRIRIMPSFSHTEGDPVEVSRNTVLAEHNYRLCKGILQGRDAAVLRPLLGELGHLHLDHARVDPVAARLGALLTHLPQQPLIPAFERH